MTGSASARTLAGMKRWLVRIALVVLLLFVAIQLVPVDRSNPPVTGALVAPPQVQAILKRSCYDCHSNETVWPWYAYVAPVSWLVAHDVEEGREHLNLSAWESIDPKKRAGVADEMAEEVERGTMPMSQYLRMHAEAKLTPADVAALRAWADAVE